MTQTVRKNKTKYGCDIYYHPNSPNPARNDKRTRFCYSLVVRRLENIETELKKCFGFGNNGLSAECWEEIAENADLQELILQIGNGAKYAVQDERGSSDIIYCRTLKEVYTAFNSFCC